MPLQDRNASRGFRSDRFHRHVNRLGSRQSELLKEPEALRARRGYHYLDYVCRSRIGMHPGASDRIGFIATLTVSAHASPNCLKNQKPFALAEDTIIWTMYAAPGSECIQGLQIGSVSSPR